MTEPDEAVFNDPPTPALPDVEQRPVDYPAVAVQVVGPVLVQDQPARTGYIAVERLNTSGAVQVLTADPRRQRAVLVSSAAWSMLNKRSGAQAPMPANVPIIVQHCSEVWALGSASEQVLSVIVEVYAQ